MEGADRGWDGCMASPIQWTCLRKLQELVTARETLSAAVHGVAKSRTRLNDWTTELVRYEAQGEVRKLRFICYLRKGEGGNGLGLQREGRPSQKKMKNKQNLVNKHLLGHIDIMGCWEKFSQTDFLSSSLATKPIHILVYIILWLSMMIAPVLEQVICKFF